jgi:hypothetical protein
MVSSEPSLIYNQKWEGYLAILLSSLVNFASVADISLGDVSNISLQNEKVFAIFGAVSFLIVLLIKIFDRVDYLHGKFDFKEIKDGQVEGFTLLFLCIWWICGVGLMTKADGIAYRVLNTYFSSWYALVMSVYTFNQWCVEKEIISVKELTRLSKTLPYWYALFVFSVVEMGSAADVLVKLRIRNIDIAGVSKGEYAVAVGAVSAFFSLLAILIHYQLLCSSKIRPGEGTEILFALLLCIWWIVAVSLLTADKAVGSTLQGRCEVGDNYELLGNNLYLSLWLGLYSAVQICLKWKAQRALGTMKDVIKSQQLEKDKEQEEPSSHHEDVDY